MNKKPRLLLVDDEPAALRRLTRLLEAGFKAELSIHTAETPAQAKMLAEAYRFDVVCLDLDLGGVDGFSEILPLLDATTSVIVVSGSDMRALEAFDHGIIDYVTKPTTVERLSQAVGRALSVSETRFASVPRLDESLGNELGTSLKNIAYLEADGNYCQLVGTDGERKLIGKSLSALVAESDEVFVRIHRKYVIPKDKIESVISRTGSRYECVLTTGQSLAVGRRYIDDVRALLRNAKMGQ